MNAQFCVFPVLRHLLVTLVGLAPFVGASEESNEFNPKTVLISRFTFERPDNWKWFTTRDDVTNVLQSVTFHVNYPQQEDACRVYLNHFIPGRPAGKPKMVAKRWKESFPKAPKLAEFRNARTIGTNKVSWIELSGMYKSGDGNGEQFYSDYGLYGAVVEDDGGNIVARIMGPAKWVKKTKADFDKMIEDAVRQE